MHSNNLSIALLIFYPWLQYQQFMADKCSIEVINGVFKSTWKPKDNIQHYTIKALIWSKTCMPYILQDTHTYFCICMGSAQNFKMSITFDLSYTTKKKSTGPFRSISITIITQQVLNFNLLTFYHWFMKKSLLQYVIPSTLTVWYMKIEC